MGMGCLTGVARKRMSWRAAIVLPFILRALIPIGFMPMFGPGFAVRLVVCEGYAPVPHSASTSMSMDMPADMPTDDVGSTADPHGGRPDHQDHGTCPFGSGPVVGIPAALGTLSLLTQRSAQPILKAPQVAHSEVSPRAQSPRAPPV
jgi:hypothetical protein